VSHSFAYENCSIPPGVTLDEYRRSRPRRRPSFPKRLLAVVAWELHLRPRPTARVTPAALRIFEGRP
jgi:hypothetical protein